MIHGEDFLIQFFPVMPSMDRKEVNRMKIEIIGDAEEIAALVLAVQERQSPIYLVNKRVVEDLGEGDRAMTARCSSENFR